MPKIISIGKYLFKLQLKMSGVFFWDTLYNKSTTVLQQSTTSGVWTLVVDLRLGWSLLEALPVATSFFGGQITPPLSVDLGLRRLLLHRTSSVVAPYWPGILFSVIVCVLTATCILLVVSGYGAVFVGAPCILQILHSLFLWRVNTTHLYTATLHYVLLIYYYYCCCYVLLACYYYY